METRTSHSSPCFLRVAEASAASSAPKMISLSTAFSFETASTTNRISLFTPHGLRPARGACGSWSSAVRCADVVRVAKNTNYLPNPSQRRESRPLDLREPYAHGEIVHVHPDALAIRVAQHPGVALAAFARHRELHLHAVVDEARKVLRRTQRAVQARRGHFERVLARKRILDVQQIRQRPARVRAVVERGALRAVHGKAEPRTS